MSFKATIPYKWSRRSANGYEVSTKGDPRFSALIAKLPDGRTIEEAYQLDIKGYRSLGSDWRLGKGKPPKEPTNSISKLDITNIRELKDDKYLDYLILMSKSNIFIQSLVSNSYIRELNTIIANSNFSLISENYNCNYQDCIVLLAVDLINLESKAIEVQDLILEDSIKELKESLVNKPLAYIIPLEFEYNLYSDKLNTILEKYEYFQIPGTPYWVNLYNRYKELWYIWASANPKLLEQLAISAHSKILTDMFTTSNVNQARALSEILNEYYGIRS